MRQTASAFAPGHITGFFEIRDEADDPRRMGSRGAGFCVDKGVTSRVTVDDESGRYGVVVTSGGKPFPAETTRRALQQLLQGRNDVEVIVEQSMDLPVSQGFGMSAAGALSACLAAAHVLGLGREEAVEAAHVAEVVQRTGLGDVVGSAMGGFEVRVEPGLPPAGRIERWSPDAPVGALLLAVLDEAILTKRVLTDPRRRQEITRVGRGLVDAFVQHRRLPDFVDLSRRFSVEARLASPAILEAYDAFPSLGMAQCMLGGSVFVFGADAETRKWLAQRGPVVEARPDFLGARVLQG